MSPPGVGERQPADSGRGPERSRTSTGRRRPPWLVFGIVAALIVVGIVGFLLLQDDDDDDDGPSGGTGPAPSAPPPIGTETDGEGEELLDLLAAGAEQTYHATYTATGDPAVIGSEFSLQVWRRDGQARQDARQVGEGGTVDSSGFFLDDGVEVTCQRIDEGEWTCAQQQAPDEATAYGVFGTIARELEGADVVVTEEEIAGRDARCFSLTGPDGEVSVCLSEEGIPLARRGGGVELVLTDLSDDVPDDIFTPPAEPVTAEGEG